jgi:His-Xaa-Ser system protein HxsD
MTSPAFPASLAGADLDAGSVHLLVQRELYPVDALFAAAFTFINDCWVVIDVADDARYRVVLTPKTGAQDAATLQRWIGGFANELLSCAYRHRLARDNRVTVEAVTLQALAGAMGPPTLDELEDFDFSNEAFEDPLGIAQSWEEKYAKGKDKPKEPADAAPTTDPDGEP